MNLIRVGFVSAAVIVWGAASSLAQEQPAELTQKIESLIKQLDDDRFQTRDAAEKALTELGEAAREAVTKASKSDQPEVRQRASRILRLLRKQALGLRHVGIVKRDDLQGLCSVACSADGNFLYTAAFQSNNVAVFRRDPMTGALEHVQSLIDPEQLGGVTCLEISPDGKLAAAVAFRAKKVVLMTRNADNGQLTIVHSLGPDLDAATKFSWPICGAFSPDSKQFYVADDQSGAIHAFGIATNKLSFVHMAGGLAGSLDGVRGVAVHPSGKWVLGVSNRGSALTVLSRDETTGKLTTVQALRDGGDAAPSLQGAHGICLSPDGEHIYVSVGRFNGDQAVGAYRIDKEGKVSLVGELVSDKGELVDFQGGNRIGISPDGRHVLACGTVSQTLALLERKPDTGELKVISCLREKSTGAGSQLGVADVDVSPDNRFVYATLESDGGISVFERVGK
jgi:6-phosphogluconolactonase (cycloisomerase 2 family)